MHGAGVAASDKLSPTFVNAAEHSRRTEGAERRADGNGLMLSVQPERSWRPRSPASTDVLASRAYDR